MRTLISNLNVICATRLGGLVTNGISAMAVQLAGLTERIADTPWWACAAHPEEHRERFWKPLYASAGRPAVSLQGEKYSCFSPDGDHTCPAQSRLWG